MSSRKLIRCIHFISTAGLVFLCIQCVEPFSPELDPEDSENLLVVEGMVTDQPGPFRIRLTFSVPVYDKWDLVADYMPVEGAEVEIIDIWGNTFIQFDTGLGWYETKEKELQGIPGRTYQLAITTTERLQYESTPQLLRSVPSIDSVYWEEFRVTKFDQQVTYEQNWLRILADTRAPGNENAYFKWELEETWEFRMPKRVLVNHGNIEHSPPPSWETLEVEEEKVHCWVTEYSQSVLVKSTSDTPSNEIRGFVLQTIGPPDDKLNIRYSVLVKQYTLDREMYGFFKQIRESNEETGGIYERTPAQITGNIYCCEEGKQALGYFIASAIQTKRIFINNTEHSVIGGSGPYDYCGWTDFVPPYPFSETVKRYFYGTDNNGTEVTSSEEYCTDCRIRGTGEIPDFWDD